MNFILSSTSVKVKGFSEVLFFNGFHLCVNHNIVSNRIRFETIDHQMIVLIGEVYDKEFVSIEQIKKVFSENGASGILNIDGDFVFILVGTDEIHCVSSREGIIPVYYYYRQDKFAIGTNCRGLFKISNFCIDDIDESAINDFLRFGSLIGSETFSTRIKLLEGGSELVKKNGQITCKKIYSFRYNPETIPEDDLMEEIISTYRRGIIKRTPNLEGISLLLSGGMDSRFALFAFNSIERGKVSTICFSQNESDELFTARQCASLYRNPFYWIPTNAEDFVANSRQYMQLVCGTDMFPQSYIVNALKGLNIKGYYTGWALGPLLGGTFYPGGTTMGVDYQKLLIK